MPIPAGPGGGATTAPCDWTIETTCCSGWDEYGDGLKDAATAYATLVMWAATGRRYGVCTVTVRPCGTGCGDNVGWYWDEGTYIPYVLNGVWRNCWCGYGPSCVGCAPLCQIYLPGPVVDVSEVLVDGVAVDPSAYRIDDGVWLVRTDGDCWPTQADLNVDSGTGLFEVTYQRGTTVPTALATAAGSLACEYAKACLGEDCRLPQRVTSIVRQGVQITMVDVDSILQKGLTGLPEVDQVIVALNPTALKARPRLYTPDISMPRRVTVP